MRSKQTQYGTGKFNKPFYDLRMEKNMNQAQMGEAIGGYNAHTIMRIENGLAGGKLDFWMSLQKTFDIPDDQMWALMIGKEEENEHL